MLIGVDIHVWVFWKIMFMFIQEYKSNMRAIKLFIQSFVIFKTLLALCFMGKMDSQPGEREHCTLQVNK